MPKSDAQHGDTVEILGRERLHDGYVRLDRCEVAVSEGGRHAHFTREVHDHGHGAAVLPCDPERRTVLLVRQLRLPVHMNEGSGWLVEACAGMIDPEDGDAATAIRREAREELGVRLRELEEVATVYTCPGVDTETITCFLAPYKASDIETDGGGGVDEDELIEVLEWPLAGLEAARERGAIHDAKTLVLAQAMRLKRPELFA